MPQTFKMHTLKIWPTYFEAVIKGEKTFEVRRDAQKKFRVGDIIRLVEVDRFSSMPTGRWCERKISYILRGFTLYNLPPEIAILSLRERDLCGNCRHPRRAHENQGKGPCTRRGCYCWEHVIEPECYIGE